jgi:hypothetical protein
MTKGSVVIYFFIVRLLLAFLGLLFLFLLFLNIGVPVTCFLFAYGIVGRAVGAFDVLDFCPFVDSLANGVGTLIGLAFAGFVIRAGLKLYKLWSTSL